MTSPITYRHFGSVSLQTDSFLLNSFPREVILKILSYLSMPDIQHCVSLSCKTLAVLCDTPDLFKQLLKRDFRQQVISPEGNSKLAYQWEYLIEKNIRDEKYSQRIIKAKTSTNCKIEGWLFSEKNKFLNLNTNQSISLDEKVITCWITDGEKIYTGSLDNTCKIWDTKTGQCLKTLEGHDKAIDGLQIVLGKCITYTNQVCKIWDLGTWECLQTFSSPLDTKLYQVESDGKVAILVSYTDDKVFLTCCEISSGKVLFERNENGSVNFLRIIERKLILKIETYNTNFSRFFSWWEIWDLESGISSPFESNILKVHSLEVKDSSVFLAGENEQGKGQWECWDFKTGKRVLSEETPTKHNPQQILIKENKVFTYSSAEIRIWNEITGEYLHTLWASNDYQCAANAASISISSLDYQAGQLAAVVSEPPLKPNLYIWDFTPGQKEEAELR